MLHALPLDKGCAMWFPMICKLFASHCVVIRYYDFISRLQGGYIQLLHSALHEPVREGRGQHTGNSKRHGINHCQYHALR
jgi:hypothetical protein